MNSSVILNFDCSVGAIDDAVTIDLTHWQDAIRFGCSLNTFRDLQTHLDRCLPDVHGPVLMGSGDYHHISLLLIERLKQRYSSQNPIEVVVFDNHPDNMRYPFGIHCGSWVSHVARLPYVSHVHVLGITSNDIGWAHCWENRLWPLINHKLTYWSMNVDTSWAKRLGLSHAFRHFQSPDDLIVSFLSHQYRNSQPVYLSIDKDVLSEKIVQTNWDQGCLETYHITDTISALCHRIIGSDITGDVSTWRYSSWLKRLLSSLDGQPELSQETLSQMQSQQNKMNAQLLQVLTQCHAAI